MTGRASLHTAMDARKVLVKSTDSLDYSSFTCRMRREQKSDEAVEVIDRLCIVNGLGTQRSLGTPRGTGKDSRVDNMGFRLSLPFVLFQYNQGFCLATMRGLTTSVSIVVEENSD